jgi:hypothetical protein
VILSYLLLGVSAAINAVKCQSVSYSLAAVAYLALTGLLIWKRVAVRRARSRRLARPVRTHGIKPPTHLNRSRIRSLVIVQALRFAFAFARRAGQAGVMLS